MEGWSYNGATADAKGVAITFRRWDGIDQPERITCEKLSPDQARATAASLNSLADEAEGLAMDVKRAALDGKLKTLEALKAEVAALEREVYEVKP